METIPENNQIDYAKKLLRNSKILILLIVVIQVLEIIFTQLGYVTPESRLFVVLKILATVIGVSFGYTVLKNIPKFLTDNSIEGLTVWKLQVLVGILYVAGPLMLLLSHTLYRHGLINVYYGK